MDPVHKKVIAARADASPASSGAVVSVQLETAGASVVIEIAGVNLDPRDAKELAEKLFAGSVRAEVFLSEGETPRSGLPPSRQESVRSGGWGSP